MMVREATVDDADVIIGFQRLMAEETEGITLDRETCARGVRAVFEDRSLGRYFVALEEGTVAGSLLITCEWSDWRAGMVWWIQSVYVRREMRRKGVYAGLYHHVRDLAENDPAIRGIRLYVDRRNQAAQQVYSRLGMNGEHYQLFEWMKR